MIFGKGSDMPIWDKEHECTSREVLDQLQLERLQATLNRAYKNVAFYRKCFDAIGFYPEEDLSDLSDIQKLPFTTRKDMSDSYPYEMFAVPLKEVVRVHSSSGTMEKPTVVGYTRLDLQNWSDLVARILSAGGVTQDDVVQITFHYGLLTGGLGIHYGAERIGASVLPTSVGRTDRQIKIMQDYRTTILVSTPSYALIMVDRMEQSGIDVKRLNLKYGICAGEPWSEEIRKEIEQRLYIKVTDNYGLSEVMGPGIAGECLEQQGMHINEDHFLAEIIDPKTGKVLPPGEVGELVLTTLTKEAFPVIRFRSGDLCYLKDETCSCGRTFKRMSRILGRSDDVVIIKGINIIPERIGDILAEIEGIRPVYQLVATRKDHHDELEIWVEISEGLFFDKMREQRAMVDVMRKKIAIFFGITPRIKLVEPGSIFRKDGKATLFVDRR